jgi:peptidoglycan-associated lipoprotein
MEPAPPAPESPKVEAPAEQPVARETEQPPAAEPQAPPPPAPEPPREQAAETTVPPKPVEEARVTEPEVAPPPPPAAEPPAPPPAPEPPAPVAAVTPPPAPPALSDVFFDFDKFVIRDDAKPTLERNASVLKGREGWKLLIEGHCDERGTSAYNLVLGERRAQATRDYLASLGLPASQITVTSFGKEKPFCTEHSHACWQENRRAHFVTEK